MAHPLYRTFLVVQNFQENGCEVKQGDKFIVDWNEPVHRKDYKDWWFGSVVNNNMGARKIAVPCLNCVEITGDEKRLEELYNGQKVSVVDSGGIRTSMGVQTTNIVHSYTPPKAKVIKKKDTKKKETKKKETKKSDITETKKTEDNTEPKKNRRF